MPVTNIPGQSGAIVLPGAQQSGLDVQGFVQTLMQQKAQKQKETLDRLKFTSDWVSQGNPLTEEMAKNAEKDFKSLGMDVNQIHMMGGGGPSAPANATGGTSAPVTFTDALMKVAANAQEKQTLERNLTQQQINTSKSAQGLSEAQAKNLAAETATKEMMNTLVRTMQDPNASPEAKSNAALAYAFTTNPNEQTLLDYTVPAEQRPKYFEGLRQHAQGLLNPDQKNALIAEQAKGGVDLFGGDLAKATQYYTDLMNGRPSQVTPQVSPEFIGKNQQLLSQAAALQSLGIGPELTSQFMAVHGDISKVKGWPKSIVTPEQINARANMIRANAEKLQAETGAKEEPSTSAYRVSEALKNIGLMQAAAASGDKKSADTLAKLAEATKAIAGVTGKTGLFGGRDEDKLDPKFLQQLQRDVLAPTFGLAPIDMPAFLGGVSTFYTPYTLEHADHPDVNQSLQQYFPDFSGVNNPYQQFPDLKDYQIGPNGAVTRKSQSQGGTGIQQNIKDLEQLYKQFVR